MKNVPIFAKVLLIMAAFAVLMMASAIFSTSKMQVISGSFTEAIERDGKAILYTARARRSMYAAYAALGELVAADNDADNADALERYGQFRRDTLSFLSSVAVPGGIYAEAAERMKARAVQVMDSDCANTIRLGRSTAPEDGPKARNAYRRECKVAFDPLSELINQETNTLTAAQERTSEGLAELTRNTVLMTYCVVIGGALLLLLAAFFAVRSWISGPVRELTTVMDRLAGGDNTVTIPHAERRDEFGAMARSVQVFRDAAVDKLRVEAEAAKARREAEEQRATNDAAKAEQSANLARVVDSLADGLGRISDGDLTVRLDDRFAPEYERLRSDFNAAAQQMDGLLRSIVGSVDAIRSGTGEISQAAEDLSRRTEQQAASLEQTAAALEQITTTVKRSADGATQARDVASRARADAEQSGVVVQSAVAAMTEIERSSQQVSQIIGVIDEIAFQTNLLALNAGVEAARAGDAGRGFAVVASEVRALAQRSAEAAREIKALIAASTQQVGAGVKLVGETGVALQRIVAQVSEVDGVVGQIAASAQEQATGLAEVNTAVTHMDQVTQQNAAMVEESTAASRALANETDSLAKLTSHFRLGQNPSPAEPARRPAPALTRVPSPPRPTKKAARRSEALALVPAASDQEWQEF